MYMDSRRRVSVTAAGYACKGVPLCASVNDLDIGEPGLTMLNDLAGGRQTPAQLMVDSGRQFLYWIENDLSPGEKREYEVLSDTSVPSSCVELADVENERIEFRIEGALFTGYCYGGGIPRPFLYPVIGPGGRTSRAIIP